MTTWYTKGKMKKSISILLLLLLLPVSAHAMAAGELAAKLQESYDKTADLRADFTQDSLVKAMNISRQGSGTLVIKKPGLLRYTYEKPDRQEIIVKGDELVMYMPESKQAVKRKLDRAAMDKTPATFLAGLGRITDSFKVNFPKAAQKDKAGNYILEMTPRGNGMGIKSITLTVDPATYGIKGFSFVEESGNVNAFALKNIRINQGVKDSAFDFKIPGGVKIITE